MRASRRSPGAERPSGAASWFTVNHAARLALAMTALVCLWLVAPSPAGAEEPAATRQATPSQGEPAPHSPPAEGHAAPTPDPGAAAHAPAAEHAASAEGHGEAEHGESPWAFIARLVNFVLFVGGLYYLLRKPLANYLDARSRQIRSDLDNAAHTREESKTRLADIDRRLSALPGEIEAMRTRGKHEIEMEQARIRRTAETERARLLEQTRREIDRQVRIARRDLTEHAANLAVDVARTRLAREITDADQMRLVDRYVTQVRTAHE